jgi:zinc transporter ZupT
VFFSRLFGFAPGVKILATKWKILTHSYRQSLP